MPTITRTQFVGALRQFIGKYKAEYSDGKKVTLELLLDPKKSPESYQAFWKDPVIYGYLTRSIEDINFSLSNHPQILNALSTEETSDSETEANEVAVYKHLSKEISYRNENIETPDFYLQGTTNEDMAVMNALLKNLLPASGELVIGDDQISNILRFNMVQPIFNDHPKLKFSISMLSEYHHMTTLLTIFHPVSHHALAAVLINSGDDDGGILHLLREIKAERQFNNTKNKQAILGYIAEHFPKAVHDDIGTFEEKIYENSQENTICVRCKSIYVAWSDAVLRHSKTAETIILIAKDYNQNYDQIKSISTGLKIPFILANHPIQTQRDDSNCGLYSFNFMSALIQMLQNQEIADRVIALAKQYYENPKMDRNDMKRIFQDELKLFLACYYDKDGQLKSEESIRNGHLKQRWEFGRASILLNHPQEEPDPSNFRMK